MIKYNINGLKEIPGMSGRRGEQFVEDWQEHQNSRETMQFLHQFQIPASLGMRIYQKYLDNKLVIYQKNNNCSSVWWMMAIVLPNKIIANKLMKYLKSKEIDTRNLFKPLNRMKFLKTKKKDNKNSDYLYKHGLYLPSGFDLKLKQIKLISKFVNNFILLHLK